MMALSLKESLLVVGYKAPMQNEPSQGADPRLIGAYCAGGTKAVTEYFKLELTMAVMRGGSGLKEKSELASWEEIVKGEFPCANPDNDD
jgi:hypothetical protein